MINATHNNNKSMPLPILKTQCYKIDHNPPFNGNPRTFVKQNNFCNLYC